MSIPKEDLKYLTDKQRKSLKDKKMPESQALQWIAEQKNIENINKKYASNIITILRGEEEAFKEFIKEDIEFSFKISLEDAINEGKQIEKTKGHKAFLRDEMIYGKKDKVFWLISETFTGEYSTDSLSGYNKESYLDVFFEYVFNSNDVILNFLKTIKIVKENETISEEVLEIVDELYSYDIKDVIFDEILEEIQEKSIEEYINENELDIPGYSPNETYEKLLEELTANDAVAVELFKDIGMIKGDKLITMSIPSKKEPLIFDISKDHEYLKEQLEDLEYILTMVIHDHAGIVIREFTDEIVENVNVKNMYGVVIVNGTYRWLNEEEVFESQNTDHKTGELLTIEPGLNYCGFYFKK